MEEPFVFAGGRNLMTNQVETGSAADLIKERPIFQKLIE